VDNYFLRNYIAFGIDWIAELRLSLDKSQINSRVLVEWQTIRCIRLSEN
jgi:hypothetical protein